MLPRKEQIKKYFNYAIIIGLVIVILLQNCKGDSDSTAPATDEPKVKIEYKTVYKNIHDTVQHDVHITDWIYKEPEGEQYTSGENIDSCKARFNYLLHQHAIRRIYTDTIKLDSLGTLTIVDTVFLNKLKGERVIIKDINIPLVTKTVTITKQADPVRQLYVGGNLFGDKTHLQYVTPGILYKDRKDRVYQANLGINFDGTFVVGLGAYWKIKFHK